MKNALPVGLIATVFTGLILLSWRTWIVFRNKKEIKDSIRYLPRLNFKFIRPGNDYENKRVIINHFSPDCTHCQYMAQKISLRNREFFRTSFIMITKASEKNVTGFLREYKLDSLSFLSIAIDTADNFYQLFGTAAVPCFFVYDKSHKLIKSVIGETSIDNLLY